RVCSSHGAGYAGCLPPGSARAAAKAGGLASVNFLECMASHAKAVRADPQVVVPKARFVRHHGGFLPLRRCLSAYWPENRCRASARARRHMCFGVCTGSGTDPPAVEVIGQPRAPRAGLISQALKGTILHFTK